MWSVARWFVVVGSVLSFAGSSLGFELPKTKTVSGALLFKTIGQPAAVAKKLNPVMQGGFNAEKPANAKAFPFKASKFMYDFWEIHTDRPTEWFGKPAKGAHLYAYLYDEIKADDVFKVFGLDRKQWKASNWVFTTERGKKIPIKEYTFHDYHFLLSVRDDKAFTTFEVYKGSK